MNFKEFIAKLAPTVSKRSVITEISIIRDSLNSFTIPAAQGIEETFGKAGFKSRENDMLVQSFNKATKQNNFFKTLSNTYNTCNELLNYLEKQIDEKFAEDITRASLSLYIINVLQLVQTIGFMVDFGRRLNLYIINKEISAITNNENGLGKITKAEEKFINGYKYTFMNGCTKLSVSPKQLEKQLEDIPGMLVDIDNIEQVREIAGIAKSDPVGLSNFNVSYNPFAFVASRIASYQAKKYKQAHAELEVIQAKLLHLKQLNADEPDAKVEKQIAYYTDLNNALKAEIAAMDDKYELN